jgi:L-galactono-1,4-lactone dehydrogenase
MGFHPLGMVSLANLDKVINVDKDAMTVTVQAGARVSQVRSLDRTGGSVTWLVTLTLSKVVDALRPYGLTLPNLASIAEQQMGGFIQVGAHGTGARIAPVDHYVTSIKMVTPGRGTIELSAEDGELFQLAKVGLGCLGVVTEVTMQCIPAHRLVEHTFVLTREEAKAQLDTLLKSHKHVRYMWIPYRDAVVVVTNDPEDDVASDTPRHSAAMDKKEQFRPLTELLSDVTKDHDEPFTEESMQGMGFGEIRDALLAVNPLDVEHVKRCNEAEAEFWRRCEGYQTKPSDELLQFDCGGQVRKHWHI